MLCNFFCIVITYSLFVNGIKQNMFDLIITFFCNNNFFVSAVSNVDILAGVFDKYLAGMSNVRILSILLMLLAIIVFLFLVIVVYVKSIISFLKLDKTADKNSSQTIAHEIFREKTEEELALEKQKQQELEDEKIRQEEERQNLLRQQEELNRQQELKAKQEQEILLKKQEQEKEQEKIKQEQKKVYSRENPIDLDWEKGKIKELEKEIPSLVSEEILSYKQTKIPLPDLTGLVLDMLARRVDDLKIAQTVMYRNQGQSSEDAILQIIEETKNFIALLTKDKFLEISKQHNLPSKEEALYHLSEGDATYALAMLEALMDANIQQASSMTNGEKRESLFMQTSYMACTFGTLASLQDIHLATGAFELAIELYPSNVNAWNRAADMYLAAGSNNQAAKFYQKVIDLSDEEINAQELANANKMLSQYYYGQGNNLLAAKLYNSSKFYYDSLGINRHLDKQEIEIVEIIEKNQQNDLQKTVANLLGSKDFQLSYSA